MKLNEVLGTEVLQTHEEIEAWLRANGIDNFMINEDLTVDVNEDVKLRGAACRGLQRLPVQFGTVKGLFMANNLGLQSMLGFPRVIDGNGLSAMQNKFKTLEGIPEDMHYCRLEMNKGISLKGVHKLIKQCENFSCSEVSEGGLGLLAVKGMAFFDFTPAIVCNFLKTEKLSGEHDIHQIQELMIAKTWGKWARL